MAPLLPSFTRSATLYDPLYAAKGKDYAAEADRLRAIMGPARTLLDVACGTGEHLRHLAPHLEVAGADRCAAMLAVARTKLPGVMLVRAEMTSLDLGHRFDVVTSLFSSVGYLPDVGSLRSAVAAMGRHVEPGGLLVVEPALLPERVAPAREIVTSLELDDMTVVRRAVARREDDLLQIEFEFELRRGDACETFRERHPIRLFEHDDYVAAFAAAGLAASFDERGCSGLGLYLGRRRR